MNTISLDQVSPLQRNINGAICIISGVSIALVACGIIPVDPSRIYVPLWVLGVSGLAFLVVGIMALIFWSLLRRGSNIFWAIILILFCSIAWWIAFWPWPRMFNGGSVSPIIGRMVFWFGAIVIFFLTWWALSMAYHDDPVEPGKSVEMSNWVLNLFLVAVITEITILRTFLLPDGSWNI